jgi:hypothetical protein
MEQTHDRGYEMNSEMDVMNMDERQRRAWLLANRATLFVVGVVWICMIGWALLHGRTPYFLIVMVPLFALVRFFWYRYYLRVK